MMDRLATMLKLQQDLQTGYRDGDPFTMQNNEHRIAFMSEQFGNIIHELVEARDEMTWKSWHQGPTRIEAEMALKELVDAWHFFMNWMLTLGPLIGCRDTEELAEKFFKQYERKNKVNFDRRNSGNYDGMSSKCPGCGRAQEEAGWVEERTKSWDEGGPTMVDRFLVCPCGKVLDQQVKEEASEDG